MKFILKSFLGFLSVFIFNQNYTQASSRPEEALEKETAYKLIQLHQTKLDPNALQTEVEKLTQQGFPLKRAREIYAQGQIGNFFATKYNPGLFPASVIPTQMRGSYISELYKTDDGVLDEVFTTSDVNNLKKDDTPIVYNETHFVEDGATVQPTDFKDVEEKYTHNPSYSLWNLRLTAELKKPCGTINVSLPVLSCKPLIDLYFQGNLKRRLDAYRLDHTLTTLKADGTLTLFDVAKRN
jgi:hypothetical protein